MTTELPTTCGAAVRSSELVSLLRDALLANQIFHTPIALRRRGGQWDEYEIDAINRTREALAAIGEQANDPSSATAEKGASNAR